MYRMMTMISAALFLLFVPGLSAQAGHAHGQGSDTVPETPTHGMMGAMMGQQMMGSRMMAMTGGPGPMMLLRMRDALELTEKQVGRLEAIHGEFSTHHREHMEAAMSAHASAIRALQGASPDLEAYEESLEQAAGQMVQAHVAMAKAAAEARTVLTSEQRERLQRSIQMMRSMMGHSGSGGMMNRDGPPH